MKPVYCLICLMVLVIPARAQYSIPVTSPDKVAVDLYRKGFKAVDEGNTREGEMYYRQAIERDSSFALALMQLAILQSRFADRSAYMARAMRHLPKASQGEQLWILARNAFYGDGKRQDEFGFCERLVLLHPNDAIAQYLYGYMNHHHGRKNFQKAIEHLEKSIQLDPAFLTALDDLATAYMEIRDFQNAERILFQAMKLQPAKAKFRDTYGELLLRSGQYEKSIEAYKSALEIDPAYAWSVFGLVANLNFLGRYQEARSYLQPLLKMKLGERDTYHVMLAFQCSFLDEGKIDSAIYILKQHGAIAREKGLFTQRYMALGNATRICFEFGDTTLGKQAIDDFFNAIQTETSNESLKTQVSDLRLFYNAYSLYIGGQLGMAKKILDEYVKKRGRTDDQARLLLAKIFIKENNFSAAESFLRQCDQESPYIQFWLGKTCLSLNKPEEAKALFNKIVARNEHQELDYHLVRKKAIALLRTGA